MDAQPQKQSYKLVWIAGASFVVLAIVIGLVVAFVPQANKNNKTTNNSQTTNEQASIATKEQVKEKLDKVDASLKQAATDHAAAKAAIQDDKKRAKVGN